MEKVYQEGYECSKTVVKLYAELAKLEKNGKAKTQAYRDMFSLLKHMISNEKQKYKDIECKEVGRMVFQQAIAAQSNENYFLEPNVAIGSALRFANFMDSEYLYTLDGVILNNEDVKFLQKNLDLSFFNEMNRYLKYKKVKEGKNALIDFKYGLLATSSRLEENIALGDALLPFHYANLDANKQQMVETYIVRKVTELINYLVDLTDCQINAQTLPIVLYVKACFCMLPPLFLGTALTELSNCFGLNRLLGIVTGESREQITELLRYLTDGESGYEKTRNHLHS